MGNLTNDYMLKFIPILLKGLGYTVGITLLAFAIALIIGLVAALGKMSKNIIISNLFSFYISAFRGTPFYVQLMFIYFALPEIGLKLTAFEASVLGLALNNSAYLAEIYRAGIQAVPKGQIEAAKSIGMQHMQMMRRIVLPQAIKNELPSIGNIAILCLKNSSIAATIAVGEIMYQAQVLASDTFRYLEVFTLVGIIYWVLHYPLKSLVDFLEKRGGHRIARDAKY
ncbi:amino acid ABC transporter permease [Ammoniphilus sp. 3BR4]|uniref:amino acid ABC transporter permease n=1 Tax=Ammoniphilus sp. 3BR4 TaxID=3158265 RepID=UPI003466A25E